MNDINTNPILAAILAALDAHIDARITAALEGAVFEAKVGNIATKVIADSEAYKAAQGEVTPIDEDKLKEMVSSYVDGAVQEAIADHCNDYDHDEMVNVTDSLSNYDLNDFITNDNLHDSVREIIDNMTFEVRVS